MFACKRKAAVALLLAFLCLPLFSLTASAQGGIKISPAKMELTVDSGQKLEETIDIENQDDKAVRVYAYVMDFSIDKNNNFTFSEPGHESYSCARWLGLEETSFDLAPGESRSVKVTISIPQEVEPGGHYAALFLETSAFASPSDVSVKIATRIPALFYVTIPGTTGAKAFANAEIASLILPEWAEKGPVETGAVVNNTGNVHLTIAAKAYFSDFRGRKIGELDLGEMVILPDSERVITGKWEETPLAGKVNANVVIGYYDQQGELVNKSDTAQIWIIPWKLGVIIVASVIVVALMIWMLRKRYHLRLERK